MACGAAHSLAVTNRGTVFAFGANSSGQLGRAGPDAHEPAALARFFHDDNGQLREAETPWVIQAAAGARHSALLTSRGHIYVFGSNAQRQLGLALPSRPDEADDDDEVSFPFNPKP